MNATKETTAELRERIQPRLQGRVIVTAMLALNEKYPMEETRNGD